MYASVVVANRPSNPGKPTCPNWSPIGCPSRLSPAGLPLVIAGFTYFAPNSPRKPLYPPASSGRLSGRACWLPVQMPPPFAQWMAKPMKSVCARLRAAVPAGAALDDTASFHSAEPAPNTLVMSPLGPVAVFSSTMLAGPPAAPQSQPPRVYGTHGAGVVRGNPVAPFTMFRSGSAGDALVSTTMSGPYLH